MKKATYFGVTDAGTVQCQLCPHACIIAEGARGICSSFENRQSILYAMRYGKVAAAAVDPIEKKPLFHFLPGSSIFSVAQQGCNFRCQWCQNHLLSQSVDDGGDYVTPEDLVRVCLTRNHTAIAFTYSEPLLWIDYIRDFAEVIKNTTPEFSIVMVTNGFVNPKPLHDILPFIDAWNVDIKSMNNEVYRRYIGGELAAVLRSVKDIAHEGSHLEITNLLIPGINDSYEETRSLSEWIKNECGESIPLHITRYHPSYLCTVPEPPVSTIENAYEIAREHLSFVYAGNISHSDHEHTYCPSCGTMLIERTYHEVHIRNLKNNVCGVCAAAIYGKF